MTQTRHGATAGPTPDAFRHLTHQFPVSKTISFQLVPMYETDENIRKNRLSKEEELDRDLSLMKEASDRIHKRFIERTLSTFRLKYLSDGGKDSLQDYFEALSIPEKEKREEEVETIAAGLKAAIGGAFAKVRYDEKQTMLQALASKALLEDLVPSEPLTEKESAALRRVQKYTTMMRRYFTTRARMYDAEAKGHTIPNRIIDDNLPIHMRNTHLFAALPQEVVEGARPAFEAVASSLDAQFIEDVFTFSAFATLLSQTSIDAYNTILGGIVPEEGEKIKGINELVNLYNQKQKGKTGKVLGLEKLKKQILSDSDTLSWIPNAYEKDSQILDVISRLRADYETTIVPYADAAASAGTLADQAHVWISAERLDAYSRAAFGDRGLAGDALMEAIRRETPRSKRISDKGYEDKVEKAYKARKLFSAKEVADAVTAFTGRDATNALDRYILENVCKSKLIAEADTSLKDYTKGMGADEKLGQSTGEDRNDNARTHIRKWLDALMDVNRAVGVFCQAPADDYTDPAFGEAILRPWSDISHELVKAYNGIRNYLTKKPYDSKKLRLMFDNPTLMGGWDIDKEKENRGVFFKKDGEYYLGILPAHAKKLFADGAGTDEHSPLKKMDVKYLKNPHMTLPGVCFGKAKDGPRIMHPYDAPPEVFDLYRRTYYKEVAVKDYTPEQVAMMIDFYKRAIGLNPAWGVFEFDLKPTSEYKRLNDFYEDLARQNYRMSFRGVSENYVREAVADGNLYLFRITCQDMREAHHGKDGNFKILLEEAFSERNRREDYVRLAGDAAVYYRKASLEKKVTHPAGIPIANKNPDNVRRTHTLPYDLYKDKRYMENRYMLHLPVLIDPAASRYGGNAINARVQDVVRRNPGIYVLGINRGERSLVNVAVTAPDGTIVEQRNLNVFDGYDYRRRLTEREHERTDDRQNWNAVRDIKNLKAGYLSRVVGEIVRLQKKYGCIIAMERLDMEFKQGRRQFERNVYEQFERDIVNRFILLMDKEDPDRTRTALQLASPGKTVEDRTKYGQNGVILFVAPGWVTKTDPLTGFANRISTRYVNIPTCEKLMSSFDSFRYDPDKGRFVLTFRWGRVTPGRENGDPNRVWNVETAGTRFAERWTGSDGKEHKDHTVRLTYEMQKLLDTEGIPYKDGDNLIALFEGRGETFWKRFLDILRLTLRNTDWNPETREFRIVSCTADSDGRFYDSRTAKETMPKDADILAAWNIARKAHMILRNIREYDPFDPPKDEKGKELPLRLSVRDEEWFAEVQG